MKNIVEWFESYKGENIVQFQYYSNSIEALRLVKLSNKYFNRYGVKKR